MSIFIIKKKQHVDEKFRVGKVLIKKLNNFFVGWAMAFCHYSPTTLIKKRNGICSTIFELSLSFILTLCFYFLSIDLVIVSILIFLCKMLVV